MAISYDNLCAILKEKDMMKTGPVRATKIGTNAMAKLGKNEDVRVGILIKICTYLECKIDDIIEIVLEQKWREIYGNSATYYTKNK